MIRITNVTMNRHSFIFTLLLSITLNGCGDKDEPADPETDHGKITFSFLHLESGQPLVFDTLAYVNEAGNPYMVSEIQYFISDVTLFRNDGYSRVIGDWQDLYYVDTDLEETLRWEVYDKIEPGIYDSIGFRFGISAEKNISFMYVNPPERDMFWPEYLGGGYHYLKLNGKWLPEGQGVQTHPFNFHLGIGQEYFSYPDSITGFIHNDFWVSLPGSDFKISDGETVHFEIQMHVENWFHNPHTYDHDFYGGDIMQNQEAMLKGRENGWNVFTMGMKE
jgi:hypothetical protein